MVQRFMCSSGTCRRTGAKTCPNVRRRALEGYVHKAIIESAWFEGREAALARRTAPRPVERLVFGEAIRPAGVCVRGLCGQRQPAKFHQ